MRCRRFLITALCLSSLTAASGAASAAGCADGDLVATAANAAQINEATLCLVNEQRAANGVAPLAGEPRLARMAADYAGQMVARSFFAHVSPSGQTLRDRFAAFSYDFLHAGENLAQATGIVATPARIVDAWMASAGHRKNILSPDFREVGMGYAVGAASTTFVNEFGTPQANAARAAVRAPSTGKTSTRRHRRAARARKASVRHRQGMLVRVVAKRRP